MSVSKAIGTAIRAVGGDPTEPEWEWLALKGPHGDTFTWGQMKSEPPEYVGVEHLERIVLEKHGADSDFPTKARKLVNKALSATDVSLLRRAIQVGAVVGADDELRRIQSLTEHEDPAVVADAKAGAFYLKRRLKRAERHDDA